MSCKLYEISALVSYHTAIAAVSKEDALDHVADWENAWHQNADLIGVSDVELFDVRELAGSVEDEAHDVTAAARKAMDRADMVNSDWGR